mgnify:CR=1 FL=1
MNIKFLSLSHTFDINQIGGTDSYMRRLSDALIDRGHKVEWIFYESNEDTKIQINNLEIKKYKYFRDALEDFCKDGNSVCIVCYLKPFDRFRLFKLRLKVDLNLYSLSWFYPDSLPKKFLRILETSFIKYKGIICVSKRLNAFHNKIGCKSYFLPPIIPDEFFEIGYEKLKRKEKHPSSRINALFLGRLDPRKGIFDVISLLDNKKMMNILNWTISGILIEKDKGNVEALNRIKSFSNINFFKEERGQYTKDVDERVKSFFLDADIFFQPYRSLSSTVDLPLLLLESQAAGCIVLTSLPDILNTYLYGSSKAIENDFTEGCINFFLDSNIVSQHLSQKKEDIDAIKNIYSERSVLQLFNNFTSE